MARPRPLRKDYGSPGEHAEAVRAWEREVAAETAAPAPAPAPAPAAAPAVATAPAASPEQTAVAAGRLTVEQASALEARRGVSTIAPTPAPKMTTPQPFVPPIDSDQQKEDKNIEDNKRIINNADLPSGPDAFLLLKNALEQLGLTGLDGQVRDLIARSITKSDDVLFYLRDTEQYKTRFKANEARKQKGLSQLLPAAYVALEQSYKSTLIANGFDPTLYDEYTDFQNLISGDVSVAELQNRINEGYRQVADADPEVIRQMQELYDVTPGQLAQYFLDPQKTLSKLKQQANAASLAARAKEQGKLQLTPITAEELVSRGYTEAQAQQAFSLLSEKADLFSEMAGEEALTESQKIGAAFGYDVSSQQAIEQRAAKRKAVFQGGGSFARTSGVTSGTIETGLGQAE